MLGVLLAQMPRLPDFSGMSRAVQAISVFAGIFFGVICLFVWRNREGNPLVGFLWGALLGPLGLFVVLIAHPAVEKQRERETRERMIDQISTKTGAFEPSPLAAAPTPAPYMIAVEAQGPDVMPKRACPLCEHQFQCDVTMCPRCGRNSDPWRYYQGYWFTKNEAGEEFWLEPEKRVWLRYQGTPP